MPCTCGQRMGLEAGITSHLCSCSWACMKTDILNPKLTFPYSPPCTFSSFSCPTYSHTPSLLLPVLVSLPLRKFFPSFFFFFFPTLLAATTVPFLTQRIQSFSKAPQKIPPILPHWWNMCSHLAVNCPTLRGWRKHHPSLTLSSPLCFLPLSSEGKSNRQGHATKGKTCKGRILLVLFTGNFSFEWG